MSGSTVAVLLSTYAGERYLPAQLDSLAQQYGVAWRLFWRDDGSPDATAAVVEAFAARQPDRVARIEGPAARLGPARSFMTLLAAAPEGEGITYAFCDQDDVWLPHKLERAAAALAAVPPGQPALYCSRQRLVGPDLAPIGLSSGLARPAGFRNALVQNVVTGCTAVLNAAARRVALAAPMPQRSMHDWWCYLTVTGAGGRVIFDDEPGVLYRQHAANAVGVTASLGLRGVRAAARGPRPFLAALAQHLVALATAPLTPEARRAVRILSRLHGADPLRRLALLRQAGVYRQRRLEDAALRLWVALMPLPKEG